MKSGRHPIECLVRRFIYTDKPYLDTPHGFNLEPSLSALYHREDEEFLLVVATAEAWNVWASMHPASGQRTALLLIDEIHLLAEPGRGAAVEELICSCMRTTRRRPQVVGASGTFDIARVADWLDTIQFSPLPMVQLAITDAQLGRAPRTDTVRQVVAEHQPVTTSHVLDVLKSKGVFHQGSNTWPSYSPSYSSPPTSHL